jgi:hypothetical protein
MNLHLKAQIATVSTISADGVFNEQYKLPGLPRRRYYGASRCLTLRVRQHLIELQWNSLSASVEGAHRRRGQVLH